MDDPAVQRNLMETRRERRLSPPIDAYLEDVVRICSVPGGSVVSTVLFGSVSRGGYEVAVSDVDLLLVLHDDVSAEDRRRVRDGVAALESVHGLARRTPPRRSVLEVFASRITANERAFFICTRSDLLSGRPSRILGISPAQAAFVDRIAIPSLLASAVVLWGEELLSQIPLPPIRRLDVGKAFFGLFSQVLFCAAVYPALPGATKYAMDAMKRSVHSCYFCHRGCSAPLTAEVAYFEERYGGSLTLTQLLLLRREYHPAFGFVLKCLPTIAGLHLRTALGNRFPQAVVWRGDVG